MTIDLNPEESSMLLNALRDAVWSAEKRAGISEHSSNDNQANAWKSRARRLSELHRRILRETILQTSINVKENEDENKNI